MDCQTDNPFFLNKNGKTKSIIRRVGPDKCGHWEIINN